MDVDALRARAEQLIDTAAYEYYVGGSDDEITVTENVDAWRRIRFRPHVMRDVSSIGTGISLLGSEMEAPILIAPMAAQRLAHDEGERAMARAAEATGTAMVVSTMATTSLEDVAEAAPDGNRWFQMYVHRDRVLSADLLRRAAAAGYTAIVLTVDVPILSRRRREDVHHFQLPAGMRLENVDSAMQSTHRSGLGEYTDAAFDPGLTPEDIGWIRSVADLPVVVKGILRGDDASLAVDAGAAAVVVSNHGGRQLDAAITTADALPDVVASVGGQVPVLVDGGIRGGYDVVKALALGASAVLVGRPFLWGLAVDGADGAASVMEEFIDELRRTMALCGVTSIGQIDGDLLAT